MRSSKPQRWSTTSDGAPPAGPVPHLRHLACCLALGVSSGPLVASATPRWLVLPVSCSDPPPADPTLLRLTKDLAGAIHEVVEEEIRVASREARDDRCPREDADCPPDIARMLDVERVVALSLAPRWDVLTVRVFATGGLDREGKLPCRWADGAVECQTDELARILAEDELPPLDEAAVKASFDALRPRLGACGGGDGAAPGASIAPDTFVSFRARPEGRVSDVRIEPAELQGEGAYACVARHVESLRVPRFAGKAPRTFRFALREPPAPVEPAKSQKVKARSRDARSTLPRASSRP